MGGSTVAGAGGSGVSAGTAGTGSGRVCTVSGDGVLQFPTDVDLLAEQGCSVIEGALVFRGPSILDLHGLETIREVESLGIIQTALVNLQGLDGLTTVTDLTISNNEQSSSLELPALKTVLGRFQIDANSGVIGFPSLQSVNEFAIVANPGVTSVRMDALASVQSFWVQANQTLTTLNDLPSLSALVSVVSIDSNPTLPQCEVDAILARAMVNCASCASSNDATGVCN